MSELFVCRVELALEAASPQAARTFAEVLEPFDGSLCRRLDGYVVASFVMPATDLGEAVAQSLHLVRYAGRQARLTCRLLGVVVTPDVGTLAPVTTGLASDAMQEIDLDLERQEVS